MIGRVRPLHRDHKFRVLLETGRSCACFPAAPGKCVPNLGRWHRLTFHPDTRLSGHGRLGTADHDLGDVDQVGPGGLSAADRARGRAFSGRGADTGHPRPTVPALI